MIHEPIVQLLTALALGLLIGLERGWHERMLRAGGRVAGIRTFALVAVSGQVSGMLGLLLTPWIPVATLLGLSTLLALGYRLNSDDDRDFGTTTVIAALLTFLLGLLVSIGESSLAVGAAVITTVLLHFKETLHDWIYGLSGEELRGILQLGLISAVLLPVLPNQTYGPWDALNPYEIWLMVVLITAISLAGYFAMRLTGPDKGVMITSAFGGVASSTATTLSLARMSQQMPMYRLLAGGILLASAIMYPRILLLVAVLNVELLQQLSIPLGGMSLASLATALWLWHNDEPHGNVDTSQMKQKPFQIGPALKFGLLLAVIMLAAEGILAQIGEQGLWIVSLVAGLTDVDAITLTLSRMAENGIRDRVAVVGITLAAISNTLVKGILAGMAGNWELLRPLIPGLGLSMAAGGLLLLV
ncbi:MgtC/SapB family protein [Marinobacterium sp. YM272]|uniref:MgtC/SapB family protein n=1 Tax=Marinobacterium sp. YM272 TaxID=3421654 RepID=UPI003D7FC999